MKEKLKFYIPMVRFLDKSTTDDLFLFDLLEDRIFLSEKFCEQYSISSTEEEGISSELFRERIDSRDWKQLEEEISDIMNGRKNELDMKFRISDREENLIWIKCHGAVCQDENGQPLFLCGGFTRLTIQDQVDPLTGLWTVERLLEDLSDCLSESSGYLMMFGIDNLKHINVKKGRGFGNDVLKIVTDTMERLTEEHWKIYRMDGDCFAVIFPKKNRKEIQKFYDTLKKELSKFCTLSAGAVSYHKSDGKDAGDVCQYAENAMDRAKKMGKNRLVFFSAEDYRKHLYQIELLDEMKAAVEEDCRGFYLCYQPQIDSIQFGVYGAEALLRYHSKTRGEMMPVEFIPLLEQSELICKVGKWVLKNAVDQCVKWRKTIPNFHINVNISYVQLMQEGITEEVKRILEQAGLPGDALTLEVTESMQLQDYPYLNRIFRSWRQWGIQIAIDDFGTGYSSLSYLKKIDIDETKIDRCFVSRVQQNEYHYRLLENMIELAHSAKIRVCCEGVETEEELKALKELNPDVLQGFLFSKPYRPEAFERCYIFKNTKEYRSGIQKQEKFQRLKPKKELFEQKMEQFQNVQNVLDHTKLGLWKIYLDPDTGKHEMYADPVMMEIMGTDRELTPEECYLHWHERISDGYYQYIDLAVATAIQEKKLVQVEYTWNHPKLGAVTVRCMTIRGKDQNGKICLEGYHRIISNLERLDFLPGGPKIEQFEFNEKKKTIYFHTKRELLAGDQGIEKNFPESWIQDQMIHPHFAGEFQEMFCQVQEKNDVNGKEMLFRAANGLYEWFKIRTVHLSRKEEDANTIAVILEPAAQERAMELEYMRKTDFYEALISRMEAHAEVDVESGHIMQASGLWKSYGSNGRERGIDFETVVQCQAEETVFQEDQELYRKYMNLEFMREMCRRGISTQEFCYRRYLENRICWMELVIHVFQDHFTGNMYALLYLKNIDDEKRRELAQENAARKDPLTSVLNRSVFKEEVVNFMRDQGEKARGALMILDMDNFKQVNDQFGHLKGDEMLKRLTKILMNTFRSEDLIGRLGGDEFLVFVKEISKKETLDRRLRELFCKLENEKELILSCSVGIRLITAGTFDYEEELEKADMALYQSKKKGKKCYSYYEE